MDKKSKWSTPVPVEVINSEFEEGTPCFPLITRSFISPGVKPENAKRRDVKLCFPKRTGDTWSEPKNIGILPDSVVAAHPALSPDGLTLYFVSDIPGGSGEKDIWLVTRAREGDAWSKPVNLGPDINTSGDELFPYVREDGTLYFSSDGLIGMGGLDIFKAHPQADGSGWYRI